MKYTRLLLGMLVVVVALWVLVGEQMSGASSDAFVNAPLVTIRGEVAGTLSLAPRALGSRISKGEVLGAVSDPLADKVRLNDLSMERDLARADIDRLTSELAASGAAKARLDARAASYRAARIAELGARLDHARQRLALLEAGGRDIPAQVLADAVSEDIDRERAEPMLPALALDHARERVAVLQIALNAAQSGVFLGDGYNDAPYAEQRGEELERQMAAGAAALDAAKARLAAIDARITREKVRVNALAGGEIHSPTDGLYWEVLQADGVTIQRGDPVVRMVDCAAAVVSLSVSENIYDSLSLGQAAKFRLARSNRVFDGSISRLAGAGAATIYENLAVAPSARHLERYDVTLIVPALATDPDLACAIGRTGRVFFDRRPLDWLRGLFD